MRHPAHPTKLRLIETTVTLLADHRAGAPGVQEVLEASGISAASLYYHFADCEDLVEQAHVARFSREVDRSIERLTELVTAASSREELLAGLERATLATQTPALASVRFERARVLVQAKGSERLRERLGQEQARLTGVLADLCREAQSKTWMNDSFDPFAAAVLVQAYTLGRLFDDVLPADEQMDAAAAWNAPIGRLVERVFA